MSTGPERVFGAFYQFAACEPFAHSLCGVNLALLVAYLVDGSAEGFYAAVVGIERKRSDFIGKHAEAFSTDKAPYCVRAHELGTVEQGKAFLGLQ